VQERKERLTFAVIDGGYVQPGAEIPSLTRASPMRLRCNETLPDPLLLTRINCCGILAAADSSFVRMLRSYACWGEQQPVISGQHPAFRLFLRPFKAQTRCSYPMTDNVAISRSDRE